MKPTVYLAGKITGDPYYFSKFYSAKEALTAEGFTVLSPSILPSEGFTWEQYLHAAGAMLDICERVCFLPDWKESRGAQYEHGRATAKGKKIFYYEEWQNEKQTAKMLAEKNTRKIAKKCLECGKLSVYPISTSDGRACAHCGGHTFSIGFAKQEVPLNE